MLKSSLELPDTATITDMITTLQGITSFSGLISLLAGTAGNLQSLLNSLSVLQSLDALKMTSNFNQLGATISANINLAMLGDVIAGLELLGLNKSLGNLSSAELAAIADLIGVNVSTLQAFFVTLGMEYKQLKVENLTFF